MGNNTSSFVVRYPGCVQVQALHHTARGMCPLDEVVIVSVVIHVAGLCRQPIIIRAHLHLQCHMAPPHEHVSTASGHTPHTLTAPLTPTFALVFFLPFFFLLALFSLIFALRSWFRSFVISRISSAPMLSSVAAMRPVKNIMVSAGFCHGTWVRHQREKHAPTSAPPQQTWPTYSARVELARDGAAEGFVLRSSGQLQAHDGREDGVVLLCSHTHRHSLSVCDWHHSKQRGCWRRSLRRTIREQLLRQCVVRILHQLPTALALSHGVIQRFLAQTHAPTSETRATS